MDSDKIIITEEEYWGTHCDLSGAYMSEKYALAYGKTFVSEFIYDCFDNYHSNTVYIPVCDFIAMLLDGKGGIINKGGHTAVPFFFDDVIIIDIETAFAKHNGKYGILDINRTSENFI